MGKVKWYKRDPNAALVGMRTLSCLERGAYNTVLDLLYAHGGKIADDHRYVAGECALSVQAWRRIRNRLTGLGKLYVDDEGYLHNNRADSELESAGKLIESKRSAGKQSAAVKAIARKKINELGSTGVEPVFQPTTTTPTTTSTKSLDSGDGSSEARVLRDYDFLSDDQSVLITSEEFARLEAELTHIKNLRGIVRNACRSWLREVEPESERKRVLLRWLSRKNEDRSAAPPSPAKSRPPEGRGDVPIYETDSYKQAVARDEQVKRAMAVRERLARERAERRAREANGHVDQ